MGGLAGRACALLLPVARGIASTACDEGYSRARGGARCGLRRQCDRKQIDAKTRSHSALTRLTSVADFSNDVSGRYRIEEWKAAGAAIERHPLSGIGLGNTITFWSPMYSPTTQ